MCHKVVSLAEHRAEANAGERSLAERLQDGPVHLLNLLRLKVAVLANRGVIRADDLIDISRLTAETLDELEAIVPTVSAEHGSDSAAAPQVDFWARLGEICGAFRSSTGIECRLLLREGPTRLPARVADILLRSLAELLTNVRKHARAKSVEIATATLKDGSLVFSVKDDGIGLDVQPRPFENGTFGLWSIGQRLREVDAVLELESAGGLRAKIVLPPGLVTGE